MLDNSSLLARRSRILTAFEPFHCRKSNIRSGKGRKKPVSCTKSNIAARDIAAWDEGSDAKERYWTAH
jgi:hypothetical protein